MGPMSPTRGGAYDIGLIEVKTLAMVRSCRISISQFEETVPLRGGGSKITWDPASAWADAEIKGKRFVRIWMPEPAPERFRSLACDIEVLCQGLILGYDGHSCLSERCRTRMSNLHFIETGCYKLRGAVTSPAGPIECERSRPISRRSVPSSEN